DRVGLLDDQVPALVEAVRGAGERERDEESEEREDRAFRRAEALACRPRIFPKPTEADPPAELQESDHPEEQPERDEQDGKREDHVRRDRTRTAIVLGARSIRGRGP